MNPPDFHLDARRKIFSILFLSQIIEYRNIYHYRTYFIWWACPLELSKRKRYPQSTPLTRTAGRAEELYFRGGGGGQSLRDSSVARGSASYTGWITFRRMACAPERISHKDGGNERSVLNEKQGVTLGIGNKLSMTKGDEGWNVDQRT
jgi:hypothetical protein